MLPEHLVHELDPERAPRCGQKQPTAMSAPSGGKETVAVLGLGRLGLCFAVVLEQAGYKVVPPRARARRARRIALRRRALRCASCPGRAPAECGETARVRRWWAWT